MSNDFTQPGTQPGAGQTYGSTGTEGYSAQPTGYSASPAGYSAPPAYSGGTVNTAYSADRMAGDKAAQLSLIFGIIGLFFAGIVFGPLAIWQAKKAESYNKAATAGKVLGWIDVIWGILSIVLFFTILGGLAAFSGSGV